MDKKKKNICVTCSCGVSFNGKKCPVCGSIVKTRKDHGDGRKIVKKKIIRS